MRRARWLVPTLVFCAVASLQLWLVARAGTDIPYQDQWDSEGASLYPKWQDGTLRVADVLQPHNEHQIVWTRLLDQVLFAVNDQWDPLVQLAVGALLRAAVAAAIAYSLFGGLRSLAAWGVSAFVVIFAFLPHLAWNNALWGFQSQVYFSVLFSVLALHFLSADTVTRPRLAIGLACGIAAQLAMSAGVFVPVAVLFLVVMRAAGRHGRSRDNIAAAIPAVLLLAMAVVLRVKVPDHSGLQARSLGNFFTVFLRIAAWPHDTEVWAALALNTPFILVVARHLRCRSAIEKGESFALALAVWALAGAGAVAWFRGGGAEFIYGVPSRYVDFFVLLPIANTWCLIILVRQVAEQRRMLTRWCAAGWVAFLLIGWAGLSAQVMRGLILPRVRDRDAPVRLAVAFQQSNDEQVFAGQWRVLVPHPNAESVRRVLKDPRMVGVLPPSLQPDKPMGPLSRAVRWLLRREIRKVRSERD